MPLTLSVVSNIMGRTRRPAQQSTHAGRFRDLFSLQMSAHAGSEKVLWTLLVCVSHWMRSPIFIPLTLFRPVYTHGGRGATKRGLDKNAIKQHVVLYDMREQPYFLDEEIRKGMPTTPIAVTLSQNHLNFTLDPMSRIRFDFRYTVQYNWKVGNLGMVITCNMPFFLECADDSKVSRDN